MFHRGVEEQILAAMERAEFDDLAGSGKPSDLTAYFETPEELRSAHSVLKNAGRVAEAVELSREIEALREATPSVSSSEGRLESDRRVRHLRLKLDLLAELRRRSSHG